MSIEPRHARYPFTEAARAAVEAADADLAGIVEHGGPVVERAVDRVDRAVETGAVGSPHRRPRIELLSYPIARVLVSLVDEPGLTRKYARAEAATAADRFRADIGDAGVTLKSSQTDPMSLTDLLAEFDLDTAVERTTPDDTARYQVAVGAYLKLAADRQGDAWRLVNRQLSNGVVPVEKDELLSLLETAVRERVAAELPLSVPEPIAAALTSEHDRLRQGLADHDLPRDLDTVVPALFPACIQTLIEQCHSGDALSDHARFAVVTFLTSIGLTPDEIVELLSLSGAKAELTRYQATHVRGDAAAAQYAPPSHVTLRSTDVYTEVETDTDTDADVQAETGDPDKHPLVTYAAALAAADQHDLTDWRDRGSEPDAGTETGPE
ncbi:MAG: eukaryotic-type DNA primase, large subunit [halophilic archaeon J07HX5]|jgi:Eukaryotic-type DNA primase, large subunit|nr:MAG: eukaryotic-type DNA primase, large subunit [halophilic archaeon J07HX5]